MHYKSVWRIKRVIRKVGLLVLGSFLLGAVPVHGLTDGAMPFSDVPQKHWSYADVHELRSLGITDGIGNNMFGLGRSVKRSEFVTYLVKLMRWEPVTPSSESFSDNADRSAWYYSPIETALKNGVLEDATAFFRPNEAITREEMAVMIVNTLGYRALGKNVEGLEDGFLDVRRNRGPITIAKDLGIVSGVGGNRFNPDATAKREEAAAMMMRMVRALNRPLRELHGFYAISSYNQIDKMDGMDSVSFGWSRLEVDETSRRLRVNTSGANGNEFAIPKGFMEPYSRAEKGRKSVQLMVFADNASTVTLEGGGKVPLLEHVLKSPEMRAQAAAAIAAKVQSTSGEGVDISFDGVVIDFESMKGPILKEQFNLLLAELKGALDKMEKKLYVAVHPKRRPGLDYFDGYDYASIGKIADKIILMAHDYETKKLTPEDMKNGTVNTPLTPFEDIYYALKAITDEESGVADKGKILLQISFHTAQWKLKNGKNIHSVPLRPSYSAIRQRLLMDVERNYSQESRNPRLNFYDIIDGTDNVVWYEDARSVGEKIELARKFGIGGISLWRLGTIPDFAPVGEKEDFLNIWETIREKVGK